MIDRKSCLRAIRNAPRNAFSLVELLVVIAVIGILVALLLPAVQAARETARRASCTNNLKQIGLALHNYHDIHKTFPPGYIAQASGTEAWGWTVFAMPYMELKPLYDELDVNDRRLADMLAEAVAAGQTEVPLLETPLPVYRCPSGGSHDRLTYKMRHFKGNNYPGTDTDPFEPAVSNYMGDRGLFDATGRYRNDGMFFGNSQVRFADVGDGTSNTFLVGERDVRCSAGTWIGCRNPPGPDMWSVFFVLGRVSIKLNDPRTRGYRTSPAAAVATDNARSNTCTEGFSSRHPNGANFTFCDGSVHFISDLIEFSNASLEYPPSGTWPGYCFTKPTKCTDKYPNTSADLDDFGVYQLLGIRNDNRPTPAL